jgi:hypothetical protein
MITNDLEEYIYKMEIFSWLRNQTQIDIKDEDGEISGW